MHAVLIGQQCQLFVHTADALQREVFVCRLGLRHRRDGFDIIHRIFGKLRHKELKKAGVILQKCLVRQRLHGVGAQQDIHFFGAGSQNLVNRLHRLAVNIRHGALNKGARPGADIRCIAGV